MARDSFSFEVKEKGRAVLPAGFREACGFNVGAEVVAVPLGPGRALLETRAAALQALWEHPIGDPDVDGVEELLRTRAAEVEEFEARVAAPSMPDTDDEESVQAFLAELGL